MTIFLQLLFLSLFAGYYPESICLTTIQPGDEIPIKADIPPGNNPHSQTQVPITCYLMSAVNTVLISSSSITTSAHVEIENTDTGLTVAQDIQISAIPTSIILPGSGHYIIYIYLPSGTMYYGEFSY